MSPVDCTSDTIHNASDFFLKLAIAFKNQSRIFLTQFSTPCYLMPAAIFSEFKLMHIVVHFVFWRGEILKPVFRYSC